MGFFSRRKAASLTDSSIGNSNAFIGRKLRSSLQLEPCLENYAIARDACYSTSGAHVEADWQMRQPPAGYEAQPGGMPGRPPDRVIASNLTSGDMLYLAAWDGSANEWGPQLSCELWFVPPHFDMQPIPIVGTWFQRDNTLKSVGSVEAPFWGA